MTELPVQWRRFIPYLSEVMNRVPQVRWDRCIPGEYLTLYGWVDRPDEHADFVVLLVLAPQWVDAPPQLKVLTSSPDPDLERSISTALRTPLERRVECQRIEEVFGGLVTNAIRLEKP